MAEIFKIVEGASRLDGAKVRNYAQLLAEKLEADGEATSAQRLRRLLDAPGRELRPAFMEQRTALPADSESRFPLLHRVNADEFAKNYIYSSEQKEVVEEFIHTCRHVDEFHQRGIATTASLLLYGPPGCGKSHLAVSVAAELNLPLYVARLDGVISSFLGSTSKNLRAIFEFASKTPCVLFLDEFDALAKIRDDQHELGELKRVVNSFIQTLDLYAKDLVVIAATNHEQLLDGAIWRRFSYLLKVDYPTSDQRRALWTAAAAELAWDEKDVAVLSDLSEGYSGGTIKMAANRLRQKALLNPEAPRHVRSALEMLSRFGGSNAASTSAPKLELWNDLPRLNEFLRQRDPRLYTQEVITRLAGVSRATLNRQIHSPTRIEAKPIAAKRHASRSPVH